MPAIWLEVAAGLERLAQPQHLLNPFLTHQNRPFCVLQLGGEGVLGRGILLRWTIYYKLVLMLPLATLPHPRCAGCTKHCLFK